MVVGGIELSGMSTTVVIPPDAAARVPVQKPSQSVRPGSLRCTCALPVERMRAGGRVGVRQRVIDGDLTTAQHGDAGQVGETDVLDEPGEDILVADVYPAIIVVRVAAYEIRVVCSGMSSFADVDYLSGVGGD